MRILTVFIEDGSKEVYFDESLLILNETLMYI